MPDHERDDAQDVTVPRPARGYAVDQLHTATVRLPLLTPAERRRLRRWARRLPVGPDWPTVQLRDRGRTGMRFRSAEAEADFLDVASPALYKVDEPGAPFSWAQWAASQAMRVLDRPFAYALLCVHYYPDVPGSFGVVFRRPERP